MSVGVLPFAGGQLHVGPVECMGCKSGSSIDDGSTDDVSLFENGIDLNGNSVVDEADNSDYQLPNPCEAHRPR